MTGKPTGALPGGLIPADWQGPHGVTFQGVIGGVLHDFHDSLFLREIREPGLGGTHKAHATSAQKAQNRSAPGVSGLTVQIRP